VLFRSPQNPKTPSSLSSQLYNYKQLKEMQDKYVSLNPDFVNQKQ
jgi:hypothetical protein